MIYDAIVVGSGPGGAVAASVLAERGKSVLLVDRQTFPRDKVCGDGLPGNIMQLLDTRLNVDIVKAGLKFKQIRGVAISAPSKSSLVVKEQPHKYFSMASPRFNFDTMLHEHALKSGAKFEIMDVSGPLLSSNGALAAANGRQRVVGIVERQGKQHIEHEARVVIAADGASSAIARGVRGRVSDTRDTAIAIRGYGKLKNPMPDYVYFKYLLQLVPGYGWIFPVSEDRVNVGVGLFDQGLYRQRGQSLRALMDEFVGILQSEFSFEMEEDTVKSWPIPVWLSTESRVVKGAYLVGDAGRFVDALTGGGIYPAMITGLQAAEAVIKYLEGADAETAQRAYDTAWRGGIARSLRKADLVQRYVGSKPGIFNAIFWVGEKFPTLRGYLLSALAGQHT
ncbi:MAG TPA: geranylgeranyl reductase family protein [Aggregatilineales bacterium]|nr:geranylgeranyl reductase family protein [Aggregatilineales bacterium]